jgi:hypothetical protein
MRITSRITPIRPAHPSIRSGTSTCNVEGRGNVSSGEEAVADGANCTGVALGAGDSVEVDVIVGIAVGEAVGNRVYVGAAGPLSRAVTLAASRVW